MSKELKRRWVHTCSIFGYFAALILGIELLMQSRGSSFCKTVTCDIVGDYTRFGETFILGAGMLFFLLLSTGMLVASRYAKLRRLSAVITLVLLGGIALEGVLLGFQMFSLQSICLICIGTFAALFLLLTLWSFAVADSKVLLVGIVVCVASIVGMYILNPDPGLSRNEIALAPVFRQIGFNDPTIQKRRLTLITSMTCPHCKTVVQQMSLHQEAIAQDLLAFAFVGVNEESLHSAGLFAANAERTDSPLKLLSVIKNSQVAGSMGLVLPDKQLIETVRQKNQRTSQFLQLMGLTGVPVLIAREDSEHIRIFVGDEAILQYLAIAMP